MKWAGGRLSEAASAMNEWFGSRRVAGVSSDELR